MREPNDNNWWEAIVRYISPVWPIFERWKRLKHGRMIWSKATILSRKRLHTLFKLFAPASSARQLVSQKVCRKLWTVSPSLINPCSLLLLSGATSRFRVKSFDGTWKHRPEVLQKHTTIRWRIKWSRNSPAEVMTLIETVSHTTTHELNHIYRMSFLHFVKTLSHNIHKKPPHRYTALIWPPQHPRLLFCSKNTSRQSCVYLGYRNITSLNSPSTDPPALNQRGIQASVFPSFFFGGGRGVWRV